MGATPPGASGDDTDAGSTSDGFPRSDDGALFGKMMRAIRGGHTLGNRIRMLKLPLILTDSQLYGGAIANFYWLTRALERALDDPIAQSHPVLAPVRALGLRLTAGYENSLAATTRCMMLPTTCRKPARPSGSASTVLASAFLNTAKSSSGVHASTRARSATCLHSASYSCLTIMHECAGRRRNSCNETIALY